MRNLIAIDGNSLLYRAYFALPEMTAKDGTPTGALHGFLMMLFKLMKEEPTHMLVAFDVHQPTFRHLAYEAYKAGRAPTPEDLVRQFPLLKEILHAMGIAVLECPGYEADDILGTYARRAEAEGLDALIVTGDRDALQLITEKTHVMLTRKGLTDCDEMTVEALQERYGLIPDRMRDLKGLMGDNSDNIPGIPGVGEKTALKLLDAYGSLENVLAHGDEIKGKLGERVRENAASARMSYEIGTICTTAPVETPLQDTAFSLDRVKGAEQMLISLELRAVLRSMPVTGEAEPVPEEEMPACEQVSVQDAETLRRVAEENAGAGTLAIVEAGQLSFAFDGTRQYVVTAGETLFDAVLPPETVFSALKGLLEDPKVEKLCYDGKRLAHRLDVLGIAVSNIAFDGMIADYLLDTNRPCGSEDAFAGRYAGKNCLDAAMLVYLRPKLEKELEAAHMTSLYRDMEMPLAGLLFRMEREGVLVDADRLSELQQGFESRSAELAGAIYELAGEEFNILSTKQLGTVLFEKLGLSHGRKTKSGYSTDADTLERLQDDHPIVKKVLEYRTLTKLKSTFLDGLLAARSQKDGRVRTRYMQCVTATGRLSSAEPNLQNIPVRTELGREIRRAFIAGPGNVLVGADYSQIELRLLAHLSGDQGLIAAFRSGEDFHRHTASEVFGVPLEEVTKEMRSAAKAVNFGIVYGISDFGLSQNLGIPVKQAASYIARYFEKYPGVKAFMDQCVRDGRDAGYAITAYGRRRPLPELKSGNYNTRSFGERVAMNMPVQGTAADIIKLAMLACDRAIREAGLHARMLLQVHDELVFEVPEAEADCTAELVRSAMEGAASLAVPLVAEVNVGHDWVETK